MGKQIQSFFSVQAGVEIMKQIEALIPPGGLVAHYDQETGSLITVAVEKTPQGNINLLRWDVNGPLSAGDATQLLRDMLPAPGAAKNH